MAKPLPVHFLKGNALKVHLFKKLRKNRDQGVTFKKAEGEGARFSALLRCNHGKTLLTVLSKDK